MARQLRQAVARGSAPLVHLFRCPRITINHGLLLFGLSDSEQETRVQAYDPNIPAQPVQLIHDRASRSFHFPPTSYWAGGPVNVIEIFCGGLY